MINRHLDYKITFDKNKTKTILIYDIKILNALKKPLK